MRNRTTNRELPRQDLSQSVETYYRENFTRAGKENVFTAWMDRIRADLAETALYGADPAFILHTLVCTRERHVRRHVDELEAIRRLTPKKRAVVVGGLRLLRTLGEPWLAELLRPRESGRARTFLATVVELEYLLTGGVMETPAWQTGSHVRVKARVWENAVTACIVCLLSEVKGHPKPAAAVANLMEKSGLLRKSRGGAAGSAFVAKRAARARDKAHDRLGPIGNIVWRLRSSYADLRETRLTIPEIPETAEIWAERGPAWGATTLKFRRAFRNYCQHRGFRGHVEAFERFEGELDDVLRHEGPAGVTQVLQNLAGERPSDTRLKRRRPKS